MTDNYTASMLGQNEKILLVTRQHWFVLFSTILLEIVVTLAVMFGITFAVLTYPVAAYGYFLVIIPILSMLFDIMKWSNHQYLVTNRRVIQLSGIFNKNVVDSSLEKVNDVRMTQSVFGRMFDYGDVEIMTASELGVNVFKRIGDPIKFKTAMMDAKEKLGYEGSGIRNHTADNIPAMIAELDELRKKGIITEGEFQYKKKELLSKM